MAGSLQSYSFKQVVVMIGDLPVEGFFEGDDAVMIERNNDTATPLIGADGAATVSVSGDDSATVTLKLQPSSAANRYLENQHKRQRGGTVQPFPVSVRDTTNGEGGSGPEATIVNRADRSFGSNVTVREWKIFVACWSDNELEYA